MMPTLTAAVLLCCASDAFAQNLATIRVGAYPNITHAQAMVGKANAWFEKAMSAGPDPVDQPQRRPCNRFEITN